MIKRYLMKRNNPWELLVLAALFCIPGVVALLQKQSFIFPSFGSRVAQVTLWSPGELHALGWFGLAIALLLLLVYFYARRSIAREEKALPPHFMEL
jgi:hypothetical protein